MKRARGQMGKPATSVGAAFLNMGGLIMKSGNMLMALVAMVVIAAIALAPGTTEAAVAPLNNWANNANQHYVGTTGNPSGTFTISAGSDRLLVVAIDCYDSAGGAGQTFAVTYGGKPLTQATIENSNRRQTWIGYLKETDIATRSGDAIAVTVTGVHTGVDVWVASYTGVDQTTPVTAVFSAYQNNTASPYDMAPNINVGAGGYGMYTWAGNVTRTSDDEGYTEHAETANNAYNQGIASKAFAAATTTGPVVTESGTARMSWSLITLAQTSCSDTDIATITTTAPTSGTTLGGTYTIQAQIGTEATPSGMTGMAVTIAGTTGGTCDVSGAAMNWNAGTSRWEYTWNTSACGNPADGGITIDVTGTDPDCGTVVNAAQIINVTIDNTCSDPDPTTSFTIAPPTSGSTISGNYLIQGTVAGESTPGAAGAAGSITIAGSSACDVTGAAMTWNSGNSKWEYTWNTSSCGDPAESGITIDASYTDPNCFDVTPATQVTSITLDNTDPYSIVGCSGCHTSPPADSATRNTPEGAVAGSHSVHSTGLGLACTECHIDNGSTLPHRTGIINMTSLINATTGSSYSGGTSITQTKTPTLGTCANTYCHSAGTSLSAPFTSTSPTWGGSTTCTTCHQKPPAYANGSPKANSHAKHSSNCSLCHNATTSDGGNTITGPANHGNKVYDVVANAGQIASYTAGTKTCNNVCCHGGTSPVWGGASIACTTCHNAEVCSPAAEGLDAAVTSRRAVGGEFGMTWSHKRTASGVVTNNDCGVCHMEGIASTGLSNATYHANGTIELRDPDTGVTIKQATWGGTNAGSYTSSGTDATFVRFSRDLASATLEPAVIAIQINHCLKCHDAAGAASTAARVPSGTALRPFNTAPTHTPGNNVLNVDAHFTTTNSSYHPVKGKQNNSYADIDRMFAPWNQATKTAATTTQWGDLMSCWDCHARPSDSGTLTNTVTAHGAADTIRGTAWVTGNPSSANAVTLCVICHKGYQANVVGGANISHGANSAFSGDTGRDEKVNALNYGCFYCHSSSDTSARPTRSADVHGFNGTWASSGTAQVAFIRSASHLSLHQPARIGASTYTPNCTGMSSGICDGNPAPGTRNKTYTVGGTY